jgi:hypothetical protein
VDQPIQPPEFLMERLSTEGRELLGQIMSRNLTGDEARVKMACLLPEDRRVLRDIFIYLENAYEVTAEHHLKQRQQAQLAKAVIERAMQLEPGKLGLDSTLREAVEVLERHGEKVPDALDLSLMADEVSGEE